MLGLLNVGRVDTNEEFLMSFNVQYTPPLVSSKGIEELLDETDSGIIPLLIYVKLLK